MRKKETIFIAKFMCHLYVMGPYLEEEEKAFPLTKMKV
jgi:hypothetical protein